MQQRLTVVRLLYAYFIDERIRSAEQNPVGRGRFTPGRAFAGKRDRGLLRHYERLPWIPGDDEWQAILLAASLEPVRNRLMLLLAYDGALRRSELVALTLRDLAFPHQQITVRPEVAKNGRGPRAAAALPGRARSGRGRRWAAVPLPVRPEPGARIETGRLGQGGRADC
jgi:integrase/recombinase XerD